MKSIKLTLVAMLLILPFSFCSYAQDLEGTVMEKTDSSIALGKAIVVTATVEAINVNKRKVVLRTESGNVEVINVKPEVKNFDQVAIGDKVTAEYYQSVAIHIGSPDEIPEAKAASVQATAEEGDKPGMVLVDVVDVIATVKQIDKENMTVTLMGPEGNLVTTKVDPRIGDLSKIKVGDKLHFRYTDAVAVSVTEQ